MPQFQLATAYRPSTSRSPLPRLSQLERTHAAGQLTVKTVDCCPGCGGRVVRERSVKAIEPEALAAIREDLAGAPADLFRFFEALWSPIPGPQTTKDLAKALGVGVNALNSRFYRAGLPSPKAYVDQAKLVRAAHLLTYYPTASFAAVARVLDQSSSQSFHRFLRRTYGEGGATGIRHAYDGPARLDVFRETLVIPYRETLVQFSPLSEQVRTVFA